MSLRLAWAQVEFEAKNGRYVKLMQCCSERRILLQEVFGLENGFRAVCKASEYRNLARLAREYHVSVHILCRRGVYFQVRWVLRRRGIFAGLVLAIALWLLMQNWVWYIDFKALNPYEQAVLRVALREQQIYPGAALQEAELPALEQELMLAQKEFSWISLNFKAGRLSVEAKRAEPVPEIEEYHQNNLVAKCSGTLVSVNALAGTQLVLPGQTVQAGDVLIAAYRLDHKEQVVPGDAAGQVVARFQTEYEAAIPFVAEEAGLSGGGNTVYQIDTPFSRWQSDGETVEAMAEPTAVLRWQPDWLGLCWPVMVTERYYVPQADAPFARTVELCRQLAAWQCEKMLMQDFPDAVIEQRQESWQQRENDLLYHVSFVICANIAQEAAGNGAEGEDENFVQN